MILSGQTIRHMKIVEPFCERTEFNTMTYGVGPAGYDVRVEFDEQGRYGMLGIMSGCFALASTVERFTMPNDVMGIVHDKSSWARRGLALQNTVIEPGWEGYLTLELSNHSGAEITIMRGQPIAQVVFHRLDRASTAPYAGKYQDQRRGPQGAR